MYGIVQDISFSFSLLDPLADFFLGALLPKHASAKRPAKTMAVPSHCLLVNGLPKNSTEHSTVKNLRVVVTTEHANGPNAETWTKKNKRKREREIQNSITTEGGDVNSVNLFTIMKMKYCPREPVRANMANCIQTWGYLPAKWMNSNSSPLATIPTDTKIVLHAFIESIICCAEGADAARIRSWMAPVKPSIDKLRISRISPRPTLSSDVLLTWPSFIMKRTTPTTISSTKKYRCSAYDLRPTRTPSNITGMGLADLPITWVGYGTQRSARFELSIAST